MTEIADVLLARLKIGHPGVDADVHGDADRVPALFPPRISGERAYGCQRGQALLGRLLV